MRTPDAPPPARTTVGRNRARIRALGTVIALGAGGVAGFGPFAGPVPGATAASAPSTGRLLPAPTNSHDLSSVSTIATGDAWALGAARDGSGAHTLVKHWDGTRWQKTSGPDLSGLQDASLLSIYAASDVAVWAVGSYTDSGTNEQSSLIEFYDGMSWTRPGFSQPGLASDLVAVNGSGPGDVWAVGQYFDGSLPRALAEHWDGTSWSLSDIPLVVDEEQAICYSVSAPAADDVWAVGLLDDSDGHDTTRRSYIEHWDGTSWSNVAAPRLVGGGYLLGVGAANASSAWAVGQRNISSSTVVTVTDQWDGHTWTQVASPNGPDKSNTLRAVTSTSPSEAWALGYGTTNFKRTTLLEHWNGSAWSLRRVPGKPGSSYYGIDSSSSSDVWMVGARDHHAKGKAVESRWDGTRWRVEQ